MSIPLARRGLSGRPVVLLMTMLLATSRSGSSSSSSSSSSSAQESTSLSALGGEGVLSESSAGPRDGDRRPASPLDFDEHRKEVWRVTAPLRGIKPHGYGGYGGPWIENWWIDAFQNRPPTRSGPRAGLRAVGGLRRLPRPPRTRRAPGSGARGAGGRHAAERSVRHGLAARQGHHLRRLDHARGARQAHEPPRPLVRRGGAHPLALAEAA